LTDTIKRLNMNMHADDPAFMRIPDTREEASQYLFLYELSIGYGMDLTDRIDVDRTTMRLTVLMANVTTAEMRSLTLRAGSWLQANAPTIQSAWTAENPNVALVTPTGVVHVFNLISFRDVRSMLTGTLIALILISGVITLALRNVRIGFISLIPNLIPALMAFGLWGYGVGAVTLAIAVVLAATLGIVVDDTVHFLSKYMEARRRGKTAEDSVRYAFSSVGMAMFVTTAGLVGGFAVLAQSGFAVNGDMAKLTALTIVVALIADFLLLPSLLIWLDQRRPIMSKPAIVAAGVTVLAAFLVFAGHEAVAETADEKGIAIAVEADARDLGFGSFTADGEMVLRDKQGRESRRVFSNRTLERVAIDVGDMGAIVFAKPRDIRGTALLTHANIEPKDDDQWLYLPAVKRVKRISSSNRTGKFVSSEFSYEDLGSQEVADFSHTWLRDEACPTDATLKCFVVESKPKNKKSGYSRRVAWIDQTEYRLQGIEFYNRRGDHEKTLTFTGYQQYLEKFWRAASMRMVNKQTGKSTDLLWTNYSFNAGLSESDFNAQRLKKLAR
ncbi:MAG: outer membrane lipoprotein-sorting protein, partial [Alphaproteobacteria bacterium]